MELDFSKNIAESEKLKTVLAEQKSRKQINDLPDSDFAYIEPGGKKDDSGKTVPRSLRHLPIMDCAHVKNALARLPQTKISAEAKSSALKKIKAAAKKCNIEVSTAEDEKEEATAQSDKQKAAKEKFLEMIKKKKKGGDKDDEDSDEKDTDEDKKKKDGKKESKAVDYNVSQPVQNLDMEEERVPETKDFGRTQPFLEQREKIKRHEEAIKSLKKEMSDAKSKKEWDAIDKKELKRDTKKEKEEHEKDAVEDDKEKIKKLKKGKPSEKKSVETHYLKKDEKEDKKSLKKIEKSTAPMGCPECY